MLAVGECDDGGRGLLGRAAKYFATISITPDHWLPISDILEGSERTREREGISFGLAVGFAGLGFRDKDLFVIQRIYSHAFTLELGQDIQILRERILCSCPIRLWLKISRLSFVRGREK